MPSSSTYCNDVEEGSQIVLERLEELSIKNLHCEDMDDSPSFGTASLPTPEAPCAEFTMPVTAMPSPYHIPEGNGRYRKEEMDEYVQLPPGAPLIKDMDSFTEGTGCGSFDDLPAMATNEHGDLIHTVTQGTVSQLPPPESVRALIERWQRDVVEETTTARSEAVPQKRHRSPSPEDEQHVRRIRPRIRAISLPGRFKAFTHFLGYPGTRSEPEDPD